MSLPSGPLAGRYPAVATMALLALVPYLALSSALSPLAPLISRDLGMDDQTLSLGLGLGNAGYALGTVLAVVFAQHLPQRIMLVTYAALSVVGSVLLAAAVDPAMFIVGHVLQGLTTSLLLIAAVPPLALGFGPEKLRYTSVTMSICIFGAVALGPTIGGIQADADQWRPLLWVVAGVAVAALVLTVLTYDHTPPANRDAPKDPLAILLAAVGSIAAFYGASELTSHAFWSTRTALPLFAGLAIIVLLIVIQVRSANPLLPLGPLLSSTIPISGLTIALCAAAASVSVGELTLSLVSAERGPLQAGLLYLPELAGALIAAVCLGLVIERRSLIYLPPIGMGFLAAGIVVFMLQVPAGTTVALVGSGLTGVGLGATVAPALFSAGFTQYSPTLQRVFAMVELLRAVAAFMIAPIFVYLVSALGGSSAGGTRTVLWISLVIVLVGTVVAIAVYLAGGARPQTPQMEVFLDGRGPALESPPLLARLRTRGRHVAKQPTPDDDLVSVAADDA
ncbi:MFS transporter [Nocardioides mangrovicus]|uniref:MFS transporter n=1 Tax=Nocardioides mangrovicus TaxID=2478913 RepID=A0A3L8NYD5_9ACTN|nr:MFS transporter [Nocardioides mangrovicus]RLV48226.1 MFS transporter [Nocardioides mangrovicus]